MAYAKLRRAESEVVAAQKALLSAYDDAYEKIALAQSKWRGECLSTENGSFQ